MKRLLACLALCASLSASAQDDNCTVLGIQDLTQMVFELQTQLNAQDATIDSLQNAAMTRDSVRAIARGEAVVGGSVGLADLTGVNLLMRTSMGSTSLNATSLVPTSLMPTSLVPTSLVPTSLVPTSLVPPSWWHPYADLSGANLSGANLCMQPIWCQPLWLPTSLAHPVACCIDLPSRLPSTPPSGYICILDPDCPGPDRYRIVPQ